MKLPRKIKKKIPKGVYCYTPTGKTFQHWNEEVKQFLPSYGIKCCPFYKHVHELEGRCRLLKAEIADQVKDCGVNFPKEYNG